MAKDVFREQSSLEELIYPIDWSDALLTGVAVTGVTITHTPPSGAAATITVVTPIVSPMTYIKVPKGLAVGTHFVSCVATTDNADLSPEVRLVIRVDR